LQPTIAHEPLAGSSYATEKTLLLEMAPNLHIQTAKTGNQIIAQQQDWRTGYETDKKNTGGKQR
jgi:hypothetical protein